MIHAIELCQQLIRFPSVTPKDEGIISFIVSVLEPLGFTCYVLPFTDNHHRVVNNLYARRGTAVPNVCFAGHVDVVPPGDIALWSQPPFAGSLHNDVIWGRGAVDMKGAIAAFISAVASAFDHQGSISLLITGDEEGDATHGTKKVIEWLTERGESIDFCIVGEPTSDKLLGDTIKVGRRGSLSGELTVIGTQGHVAYPDKASNPIPKIIRLLSALDTYVFDNGYQQFQPSNLEITSVDVGNPTANVIPGQATARLNVRFNPTYSSVLLERTLRRVLDQELIPYTLTVKAGSEPFATTDSHPAISTLEKAIKNITGVSPQRSTSGGTSDARFIKKICPVVEFGLMNHCAHKIDEHVPIQHLQQLAQIYHEFIHSFFACREQNN